MELIIGRDQETRRLRISEGTQSKLFGTPGSVPDYVSRQHLKIRTDENNNLIVTNLNPNNVTYVGDLCVETKVINPGDPITLGATRYPLNWDYINAMMPVIVDIRPLEKVWNAYHQTKMNYQIRERRFNALRSATGIITMAAILISFMGGRGTIYYIMYGLAIGITLIFTIMAYISSSKVPKMNEELERKFQTKYVCPNPRCHHFIGNIPYHILSQNAGCPHCRAQYRK